MAIKSTRRKQQSLHPFKVKNHNPLSYLHQPLSHCGTAIVRTRTMTRKGVGGYSGSRVFLLKMCLFILVFVLSNFHASLGREYHHPSHHNHNHHHHHNKGGFRTCSHRPPKPEEVRVTHTGSISLKQNR